LQGSAAVFDKSFFLKHRQVSFELCCANGSDSSTSHSSFTRVMQTPQETGVPV
jgi:hypothetical protein